MLCKVLTKVWSGNRNNQNNIADATNGSYILFNGNRINGIKVRATSKSSFMFVEDLHNPKEKASYVEGEGTAASIVTSADATWQSAFVTLNFYPDNDVNQTAVATRVNCESIAWVMSDPAASATRSYVCYFEGGKRMFKLCDYSLQQVHNWCDSGTATS